MKTNIKIGGVFSAIVLTTALFFSCTKETPAPTPTAAKDMNANYNIYLKDAPADYQAVNVNITGVAVNNSASGWVTMNVKAGIYNLLTLTDGKDTLIASGTLQAGTISQIRLTLSSIGNTVEMNNRLYPLTLSAAAEAGLTMNVNTTITAGATYNSTLDFDAGMSVASSGEGSFTLNPVITAVITPAGGQLNATGAIIGIISPSLVAVPVLAINTSASLGIADSAISYSALSSGGFEITNLATGTYKVVVIPAFPLSIVTFNNVTVSAGHLTDMGTITLQ